MNGLVMPLRWRDAHAQNNFSLAEVRASAFIRTKINSNASDEGDGYIGRNPPVRKPVNHIKSGWCGRWVFWCVVDSLLRRLRLKISGYVLQISGAKI